MSDDLFSLEDQVVLVTGGARGLGQPMAHALAKAGAHVVLNDFDEVALDAELAAMKAAGLRASGMAFDVIDAQARAHAIPAIVSEYGRFDALFNNAGVGNRSPLVDLEMENWQRVIDIDLTAGFHLAQEAAKPMIRQGWGRIITTTSIVGLLGQDGLAHYVAAKAGLVGLTKALAVELGPHGINCNAIAPGYFATSKPFAATTPSRSQFPDETERREKIRERTPLKRYAEPEELGGVAVFLASRASSYVNGHVLVVDGGLTIAL